MSEAAFAVDIEDAPETVTAGESVTITASVDHTGDEAATADEAATETVELLDADGTAVDSAEVELEAGGTGSVELEWTPDGDDVGSADLRVQAGDAEAATEVTVEDAPAEFAVEVTASDEHIPEGGTAAVEAEIENTGTLSGTQDVEIAVGDDVQETRAGLELAGGATETIAYSHETGDDDEPEVTIEVSTDDDSDSASIPVVTESVTPLRTMGSQSGMGIFGWIIFALLVVLLIPLIPIFVLLKLLDMLGGGSEPVR